MFKQLTNVQAPKTTAPELTTTPTGGTMRINAPGCDHIGVKTGDLIGVIEEPDTNSEFHGLWITKGSEAKKEGDKVVEPQFGQKLATASGKNAGSMNFSSELSYRALGGNSETREVYSIGEGITHPEATGLIYKLTKVRTEPKTEKKAPVRKNKSESTDTATNS